MGILRYALTSLIGVATTVKQQRYQPLMLGQRCNSRAHGCLDLPLHCYLFRSALRKQAIADCFERYTRQGYLSERTGTLPEDNLAKPPGESSRLPQLGKMNKSLKGGLLDEILS